MPFICRLHDPTTTGHACSTETILGFPGQATVLVEGMPAARIGDPTIEHTGPAPPCPAHIGLILTGSKRFVFVAGKLVARVGDFCDTPPGGKLIVPAAKRTFAG